MHHEDHVFIDFGKGKPASRNGKQLVNDPAGNIGNINGPFTKKRVRNLGQLLPDLPAHFPDHPLDIQQAFLQSIFYLIQKLNIFKHQKVRLKNIGLFFAHLRLGAFIHGLHFRSRGAYRLLQPPPFGGNIFRPDTVAGNFGIFFNMYQALANRYACGCRNAGELLHILSIIKSAEIVYNLCYHKPMSDAVPEGIKPPSRAPNCLKCAYFSITWDPVFPRSCEIFSIKCANMPSWEVFRATGSNCPSFHLKEGLK
jgi:hypothetical protein